MGLHLIDIYRSPNVGVFMRANDRFLLVPKGVALTKREKLAEALGVKAVEASIAESRLLGPLMVLNGRGALVSHLAENSELAEIAGATGLRIERLESKFTAAGNLVVANDRFALASPILEPKALSQIRDVLGTEVERAAFNEYYQVGALMVATNTGAAVYPELGENDVERLGALFGVEAYPTSVNSGVPYVASGIVANAANAVVGNQTTGPELVFITRALKV